MKSYLKKEECCGCGACADVCPTGAIKMDMDAEGFQYPHVKKAECVACGKCSEVCPLKQNETVQNENVYYGVQAKNSQIRYSGSSGGIFAVLSDYVLQRHGVIYGAGYDEQMSVVHQEVLCRMQLENIQKTKYVQSRVNGAYREIENRLKKKYWVLFCGTPCQTYALKLFLRQEYERLILVDLVCYGVPSPGMWEKYVAYLERKHQGKMDRFQFRDKRNRDNGQMRSYVIDGKEYTSELYRDVYCRMFFQNNSLRPSCHKCRFCTVNRNSDFTIGDFWGIENVRPDLDDGMGTSLMILHTDKAKKIWDKVKEDTIWFQCKKEDLLQPRLREPTAVGKNRSKVMKAYRILPFAFFIKWVERLK